MLILATAVRLARRLQAAWAARAESGPDPAAAWRALDDSLALARQARRRLALADDHGWALVRPELTATLAARLGDVLRQVEQLRVEHAPPRGRAPDLAAWLGEVRQLDDEFGGVRVRWSESTLRVVTEPIILEDIRLGPFAVDLDWSRASRVGSVGWFDVIALDPNPAAGRDDVVHPHVRDRDLCAGDAAEPIRQALSDGRLADAFLLVRSVLTTYNPGSPYVPLSEWDGQMCTDCGRPAPRDDSFSCEACGGDLCETCVMSCTACSAVRCGRCLDACPECEEGCCPGCLESTASDRAVCPGCLSHCPTCSAAVPAADLTGPDSPCPTCCHEEADDDDHDPIDPDDLAVAPPASG